MRLLALATLFLWAAGTPAADAPRNYRVGLVALNGKLSGDNIVFQMRLTATADGPAQIKLVGGEVAPLAWEVRSDTGGLLFPGPEAKLAFDAKDGCRLDCPAAGDYAVDLTFAAKVFDKDNRRHCGFSLVSGVCRTVEIASGNKAIELKFGNALGVAKTDAPDGHGALITATLKPQGDFRANWERKVEKLATELVTGVDVDCLYEALPGSVRLNALLRYQVIQGELAEMALKLSPGLNVLSVTGDNIQDWRTIPEGDGATLRVKLSRAADKSYQLAVEAEKILGEFPCRFALPTLLPLGALRVDGALAIGTNKAVKLTVDKTGGLTQIDTTAFPYRQIMGRPLPERSLFTYRFSGDKLSLEAGADNITPSFTARLRWVVRAQDDDLQCRLNAELDIRDAPLREVTLRYDDGLALSSLEGDRLLANDYELSTRGGAKFLRLPFKPDTTGKTSFDVCFERPLKALRELPVPHVSLEDARTARGFLVLAAGKGLSLQAEDLKELRPAHLGTLPVREPGARAAYRFKSQDWSATLKVKQEKSSVLSEAFHLYSLGDGAAYGSAVFTYQISGAPLDKLKFKVGKEIRNLEFTGPRVNDWKRVGEDGGMDVWELNLNEKLLGDQTLLATFETPLPKGGKPCRFGDVETLGAENESGYIVLTSDRNLSVADQTVSGSARAVEAAELPDEYREKIVNNPIVRVYRRGDPPFLVEAQVRSYPAARLLEAVVDHADLETRVDRDGEAVTTVQYRIKNSGRSFVSLRLPEKAKLWSVSVDGKGRGLAPESGELLVPLPRRQDVNVPVAVSLSYATEHGPLGAGRPLLLAAPVLDIESMLCRWAVHVPAGHDFTALGGNMAPEQVAMATGMVGLLGTTARLGAALASGLLLPWLLATLAGALGVWSWGKGRRWLAAVFWVLAVGAALVTARLPRTESGQRPFATNKAEFVSTFHLPNDPLEIRAEISDGRAMTPAKLGLAALGALLALAAGFAAVRTRRAPARALALAIGATALLAALSQWCLGGLLAAAALTVAVPIMLSVSLWVLLARRRALAALALLAFPLASQAADGPKLESVDILFHVTETGVRFTGDYQITAELPGELPLVDSPLVVTAPAPEELRCDGANYRLDVKSSGGRTVQLHGILPARRDSGQVEFSFPIPACLRDNVTITTDLKNMSVQCPGAVFFAPASEDNPFPARASFAPGSTAEIKLAPKRRDVKTEKAVFYANIESSVTFEGGYVLATHAIDLRVAQGELSELDIKFPGAMNVTAAEAESLGAWQFLPERKQLRAFFSSPRRDNVRLTVTAQLSNLGLPYAAELSAPQVEGAARQQGMFGLFCPSSTQARVESALGLDRVNNSDFPAVRKDGDAKLKEAYRYHQPPATLKAQVTAVRPELRVEELAQVRYDDERATLSSELTVEIAKAGVFSLALEPPPGFEVDALHCAQARQWDESTEDGRSLVTVNFPERTLGEVKLQVELSHVGGDAGKSARVPALRVKDAARLSGKLEIRLERGARLDVLARQGVERNNSLDAMAERGDAVYRFDLRRPDWTLDVALDKSAPWIQAETLLLARAKAGRLENDMRFALKIENAGVKKLRLRLPAGADAPEVAGPNVAGTTSLGADLWEVELRDRTLGECRLNVRYRQAAANPAALVVEPAVVEEAESSNGYVAVFSEDACQLKLKALSEGVTPFDFRKIPGEFQAGGLADAALCFRAVGRDYRLELTAVRYAAAGTLAANIGSVKIVSAVSPEGRAISKAQIALENLDAPFLALRLPPEAAVWAAFVDNLPVEAAREGAESLIPLRPGPGGARKQTVELIYATRPGAAWTPGKQSYAAPSFALPVRDVTWELFLPADRDYHDFKGALYCRPDAAIYSLAGSVSDYDSRNQRLLDDNISQAKALLRDGNALADRGDARRADKVFRDALNLAENDFALNRDIQGKQLELRRHETVNALASRRAVHKAGARQAAAATEQSLGGDELRGLKAISDKLFLWQQAAVSAPRPPRVTIPEKGRKITFERALRVTPYAPLTVEFKARQAFSWRQLSAAGAALLLGLGLFVAFLPPVLAMRGEPRHQSRP